MAWYFVKDGVQQGPVSDDQIRRMAQDGSLRGEDLVWREGMASWQAAREAGIELPMAPVAPYSPSPAQYSPYAPAPMLPTAAVAIPDYLPWSIAATILCCLPLGIVAIVFSAKANSAKAIGDFRAAAEAANQAKIWLYVSAGIGLLVGLVYCVGIIASLADKV